MLNLIALARIDGNIHEKELNILYKIGKKYDLNPHHIDSLLSHEAEPMAIKSDHDQCLEQLYDFVEIMLADDLVEETEISFCENMIRSMGYQVELLKKLIQYIIFHNKEHDSWRNFKKEALLLKANLIYTRT